MVLIRDLRLYQLTLNVLNENSENTDQMPHPAASDVGLHCLLLSKH